MMHGPASCFSMIISLSLPPRVRVHKTQHDGESVSRRIHLVGILHAKMAAIAANAAHAHMNGASSPFAAEDEELYAQLLRIQNAVLAGTHPQFKLSASAIAQLEAALIVPENNDAALATNHASSIAASTNGLAVPSTHAGLNPIFLQKSEHLVRAERAIKRQRLEHDVQAQGEQRKHFRFGKDADADLLTPIAVDEVLKAAQERVKPVSGLKSVQAASVSSFDENDYYSSRAPSPWSDDAREQGSDRAADAFTADYERLGAAERLADACLLYTSPSPRDGLLSRMPSSA